MECLTLVAMLTQRSAGAVCCMPSFHNVFFSKYMGGPETNLTRGFAFPFKKFPHAHC